LFDEKTASQKLPFTITLQISFCEAFCGQEKESIFSLPINIKLVSLGQWEAISDSAQTDSYISSV
jgi:hypothetical protein